MARTVEMPDEFNSGPFRAADALRAGLSKKLLSGPRFWTPFPGVRVPCTVPKTLRVRGQAASLILPEDAAFSHQTAAELCDLPLPSSSAKQDDDDEELPSLHVMVPAETTVPQVSGLTGHTGLEPGDVMTVGGLKVVAPERTFFHLATTLSDVNLVILGDAIVRHWATLETMIGRAAGLTRRRGIVRARKALDLVKPGVDSAMETRVRLMLINAGLPCPVVNRDVYDERGHWLARPDLSYPHLKIAIEYDGDHHRTDKHQWRRDRARDEGLRHAGWVVITLTADDVFKTPQQTIDRILRHFRSRSAA
jgi:hypothetical protein